LEGAPRPIRIDGSVEVRGLEELGEVLPGMVQAAAERNDKAGLESSLRKILFCLVTRGLKEFAGDLISENGSLTGVPYWVACELAHRIQPGLGDKVFLAREKGSFLRFLRGRENCFLYRKTLKEQIKLGSTYVDIAFRGRLYLFLTQVDPSLWTRLRRAVRLLQKPLIVIALKGSLSPVPPDLVDYVTIYLGSPPRRITPFRGPGSFDDYGLFCFLRGPSYLKEQ